MLCERNAMTRMCYALNLCLFIVRIYPELESMMPYFLYSQLYIQQNIMMTVISYLKIFLLNDHSFIISNYHKFLKKDHS